MKIRNFPIAVKKCDKKKCGALFINPKKAFVIIEIFSNFNSNFKIDEIFSGFFLLLFINIITRKKNKYI